MDAVVTWRPLSLHIQNSSIAFVGWSSTYCYLSKKAHSRNRTCFTVCTGLYFPWRYAIFLASELRVHAGNLVYAFSILCSSSHNVEPQKASRINDTMTRSMISFLLVLFAYAWVVVHSQEPTPGAGAPTPSPVAPAVIDRGSYTEIRCIEERRCENRVITASDGKQAVAYCSGFRSCAQGTCSLECRHIKNASASCLLVSKLLALPLSFVLILCSNYYWSQRCRFCIELQRHEKLSTSECHRTDVSFCDDEYRMQGRKCLSRGKF